MFLHKILVKKSENNEQKGFEISIILVDSSSF